MQLSRLSVRQKALGAAALAVAVLALWARSRTTVTDVPGGVDATATPAASGLDPGPSTFADNGAGFGQLSTALADGLGQLSDELTASQQQLAASQSELGGQVSSLADQFAALAAARDAAGAATVAAPALVANTGQPTAQPSQAARAQVAGQPVHLDSHGAKRGLRFVTVDRGGQTTRLYETKAGKGNFGATKASVVSLSKPAPRALPSFKSIIAKTAPRSPVKPKPTPKKKK